MYTCPIQIDDVRYNAASKQFEASVTVHDNTITRRYACAVPAPISMSFEEASKGLAKQAIQSHQARGGLFSEIQPQTIWPPVARRSSDPVQWLETLINTNGKAAA